MDKRIIIQSGNQINAQDKSAAAISLGKLALLRL
jgi:hypothetical protein